MVTGEGLALALIPVMGTGLAVGVPLKVLSSGVLATHYEKLIDDLDEIEQYSNDGAKLYLNKYFPIYSKVTRVRKN